MAEGTTILGTNIHTVLNRYLATTQFQDLHARKAFPCLDEPDLKAQFSVKLGHREDLVARSNMENSTSTEPIDGLDGYVMSTFADTVPMSTYLVAFLISDFEYTANAEDESYKIWHVKGKASQAELAADFAPKCHAFFEQYYDFPDPMPKVDQAAVPDFNAGAMENWGLILYRETALLYEPGVSSRADMEYVLIVVSHELAHMWFGNLVTMDWWDNLWLNEGNRCPFISLIESFNR